MFAKLLLVSLLIAFSIPGTGQVSEIMQKKPGGPIVLIGTMDGPTIRGRLIDVSLDYLILDADPYNAPADLTPYYLRHTGSYYKIDVEHVKVATFKTKRKLGYTIGEGALGGGLLFGAAVHNSFNDDKEVLNALYATGVGMGLGGVAGFFWGMFGHKKMRIIINGNASQLMQLANYLN